MSSLVAPIFLNNHHAEIFASYYVELGPPTALQEGTGWGESKKCTAFVISVGAASEQLRYLKSIALELYLFAYELPGLSRPKRR